MISLVAVAAAWVLSGASTQSVRGASAVGARDLFCQGDRNALTRVALAESAAEGDSGLAAVVLVIRNRLKSGRFGTTLDDVLNAPRQFEPVWRRGSWTALPAPTLSQRSRLDAIVNLICDGRVPDFTHGSLYFQNTAVVQARAIQGTVSARLVAFGNRSAAAVIGRHSFYLGIQRPGLGTSRVRMGRPDPRAPASPVDIFYGSDSRAPTVVDRGGDDVFRTGGDR